MFIYFIWVTTINAQTSDEGVPSTLRLQSIGSINLTPPISNNHVINQHQPSNSTSQPSLSEPLDIRENKTGQVGDSNDNENANITNFIIQGFQLYSQLKVFNNQTVSIGGVDHDADYQQAIQNSIDMDSETRQHQDRLDDRTRLLGLASLDELVRSQGDCGFDTLALNEYRRNNDQFDREDWMRNRDRLSRSKLAISLWFT